MAETAKKRRVKKPTYHGGLEGTLDTGAWILLWLGMLVAFVLMFIGPIGFILSIVFAGLVIAVWLLLRSQAEIVRLLKHQAGLPYGGRVKVARERADSAWECTACRAPLYDPGICDRCGRTIVGTEEHV